MEIRSPAFENGQDIPEKYTGEGRDVSPPLEFRNVPEEARSLAIIVDDPDAPRKTWVHWLAWGLPADTERLPENVPKEDVVEEIEGMRQGKNDFDAVGYGGPMPPPGHGTHHYRFTVYALDRHVDLDAGATREALERRLEGSVLAEARLVGTYQRD